MYSISGYGEMISDAVRTDAYRDALRRVVTADSVVLDIGTGTGIFALLACEFGARKVYAVEPADVIQVAKDAAAANRFGSRIEFIQNASTSISLPESADVIVSDIRGVLPVFGHHLASVIDARTRLLKSNGVLIPQADRLFGAVIESSRLYERAVRPWENRPYGVDMSVVKAFTTNTWFKGRAKPDELLTEPRCWAVLDYQTIARTDVCGELTWTASKSGIAHGLCLWFDTTLLSDIGYSNAPGSAELIYGNAFFPLATPVDVIAGDTINVRIEARLVGDDYVWRWDSSLSGASGPKAAFHQSTFFGAPVTPMHLTKRAAPYVPTLSVDGEIHRFILDMINGNNSLEDIARRVADRFPAQFPTYEKALTRAADVAERHS